MSLLAVRSTSPASSSRPRGHTTEETGAPNWSARAGETEPSRTDRYLAHYSTWSVPVLGLATVFPSEPRGTMDAVRPSVLIVDDHEDFRASARALIEEEGFEVIGEAADVIGALAAVAALRPNIVLLDIQLPDGDGFSVAEQLAMLPDPPKVVLISSRDAASYGPRLIQTSARGFLPKSALSGKALAALVG